MADLQFHDAPLAKIRGIAVALEKLAPLFRWEVILKTDPRVTENIDPPCNIIWGVFGPFQVELHADGGWALTGEFERTSIDMMQSPTNIAKALIREIQRRSPEPGT